MQVRHNVTPFDLQVQSAVGIVIRSLSTAFLFSAPASFSMIVSANSIAVPGLREVITLSSHSTASAESLVEELFASKKPGKR